jgi:integrase
MQTVTTVGLDIAKSVFQVHCVDAADQVVIRRQLKRRYVLAFFQKLPRCLIGIEACASSHYWSRELEALALPPGRHYYQDGLVLIVAQGGQRKWVCRYKSTETKRPTETTLGSAFDISPQQARANVNTIRSCWLNRGRDPIRRGESKDKTFGEVANSWIADKKLTGGQLYTANLYLLKHCADLLTLPMYRIDADKILSALRPLIHDRPVQARRVLTMLETVFKYAIGWNWYSGNNPAQWKGLHETRWPNLPRGDRHHPAMPYAQISNFMKELRARQDAASAVALELLILTACRTDEILGLQWDEINWEEKMIVLPPQRTKQGKKNGKEHRIPLTARIIEILRAQERDWNGNDLVFAGQLQTGLGEKSMLRFLRDSMDIYVYTVHGFRSTFSNWAYEKTKFDPYVIEMSMGHTWGNKVTRAYFRGDALERRRELMDAWSQYCSSTPKPGLRVVSATA